ncbi:lipase class 3 [Nitzschia inconspicua]|uniref:Lipase class 3 n=1 Tax=Nitzschia inconspicua TaxID=303405 RepID=A0A9K3M2E4_9STRA|nr:lipase class 3 [Nitzschia inconspicua]
MTRQSESVTVKADIEPHENEEDQDDEEEGIDLGFLRQSAVAHHHKEFDPKNPSLFSETYAMSVTAAAIFPFADVRQAARMGKIDAPEAIRLPLRVSTAFEVYSKHREELKKLMKKADTQFLDMLLQQIDNEETFEGLFISNVVKQAVIHYFGDESNKSECVYLLLENPELSRIVLCFRGSITVNDWVKDSKVTVGNIKNPLYMRPGQPLEVGVHLGFREYLYDENRSVSLRLPPVKEKIEAVKKTVRGLPESFSYNLRLNAVAGQNQPSQSVDEDVKRTTSLASVDKGEPKKPEVITTENKEETSTVQSHETENAPSNAKTSRITQILEQVDSLRSKNKDYHIYVTGHSLGGALAMLTALEVAAHFGSPKNPVTFIGIGNPRAATYSFRNVVETLEQDGKLRCLGVHNHLDIVPMVPTSALHVRTKNTFCQVGFQMLLHPEKFEMRYCPQTDNSFLDFKDQAERMTLAIFRPDKIAGRHHYLTYLSYLKTLEVPLSRLYLNDYYSNIVRSNLFPRSEANAFSPPHVATKRHRDSLFGPRSVCLDISHSQQEDDCDDDRKV